MFDKPVLKVSVLVTVRGKLSSPSEKAWNNIYIYTCLVLVLFFSHSLIHCSVLVEKQVKFLKYHMDIYPDSIINL